uniref:SbsA Ig-like domain-containing protein n=1 Tax=Rhizophagus clarus TaxID=94130 RepID=A0A140D065_9GLOM|nr:hypothetical protein [Rhizophagus clarus]
MSAIFRRNISLIIFITFFSILISCPSIQTKDLVICNIVTNNLPDAAAIGTFADGKILFNIGNEDSLHLIKPDGTSDFINNTCKLMDSKGSCNYHLLNPNYVIITSKHTCKVIDLMGNIILKNFKYDKMSVSEKNDRFLIMKHKNNEFTEYNVNNIGRISKRISSLYFSNKRHKITEIFSLDNAWGIISTTKGDNSFFSIIEAQAKNKTLIVEELYDYDSTDTDTTKCITNNQINDIQYYCLYISSNDNTLKLLNISNLSLNNNSFNINTTDLTPDIGFDTDTYIHVIPNVGFLVEATAYLKTKYYIFNIFEINYFDQNNAFGELIVNNTYNNFLGSHIFTLPNKTIVRMIENHNSIKFVQNDLTSKIPKNNPYNNPHIKQVYPPNNESIAIGTDKLNITFLNPIDPTIATYISIYYINNTNNDESILRQKFLCTSPYCIISKDFYSLTIYLSNNTFNIPNASYYVEIDDKFIEYKYELIKIPGIKPRNWIIKTDSILGKLRLNSTGSDKFRNLSDAKKSVFFDNMTNELVRSIPIDYWRIKNVKYEDEIDMVSGATLTTFSFQIDPPKTHDINKNSSKEVLEDLNSLIRSQGFTSNLDINNYTGDIDKDYGFQKESM